MSPASNRPKNSPRQRADRDPISPREKLLMAATDLFARHGYDMVSTGAVAEAAGMTQSMVNYHFKTKLNLWRSAIDRLMHERAAHFWIDDRDLQDLTPLPRLKVLTRRFMLASAHDAFAARIAVHEAMQRSPRLEWLMQRYVGQTYRAFDSVIEEAIALGQIKALPVADVTTLILTAGSMPFVADAWTEVLYGFSQTSESHTESYIDTVIDIIFSGLAPISAAQPRAAPSSKKTSEEDTR